MLTTAWGALKSAQFWLKIAPYLASIALVVGVYFWIDHRGYERGFEKQTALTAAEHARAEGFKANQTQLTAELVHQNAAVAALKVEGDKRAADGKTALKRAEKANQGLADQAAALRRSATRQIGKDDPCVISNTLGNMGAI